MEATLAELKRASAGRGGLSRHQGEKEVPAADADDEEGEQPPGRSPLPPALGAGRGGGGGAGNEKKGSQGSPPSPLSRTPAIAAAAAAACAPASRRGVGPAGAGLSSPCCQAEMCAADLTGAKRYHRRHKVCEAHAKAPAVMVAGLRQRFCQQCSRFHELLEFDESKRSCRRRLAGHNERRRKSSAESQGEGSNRCRQVDQSGRMQATLSGDSTYKHFQIR